MSTFELSVLFFLQLAVILAACRAASVLVRFIGQPPVVGEIVAGILLGPSLLGLFWPSLMATLPESSGCSPSACHALVQARGQQDA